MRDDPRGHFAARLNRGILVSLLVRHQIWLRSCPYSGNGNAAGAAIGQNAEPRDLFPVAVRAMACGPLRLLRAALSHRQPNGKHKTLREHSGCATSDISSAETRSKGH